MPLEIVAVVILWTAWQRLVLGRGNERFPVLEGDVALQDERAGREPDPAHVLEARRVAVAEARRLRSG